MLNCMNWGGMWIGSLLALATFGLLVWGAITLIKNSSRAGGNNQVQQINALDILKRRYARGEITQAEFREMKKELQ